MNLLDFSRYDFKPASVDTSKMATLELGPSGQVTISMPHFESSGNTVFKGNTRPYTKECVLIIDKDTGEVVLEKLTHNVQVKKTR
jgi:ELL-associated factor